MLPVIQACGPNDTGISLAGDWVADIVSENGDQMPDMMVLSPDHRYLYQSLETNENLLSPSLARMDLRTGRRDLLIHGMARADGLKMAPDGSLWLGEEWQDGLVWRIESPEKLPPGQRVDRQRLKSSHSSIQPVPAAGRFAHEGLAFSKDGRYLYLADEWKEGCLYRYELSSGALQVFHSKQGWLTIERPHAARVESEKLHGRMFLRIEDMERLPDGRILMSETGSAESPGKILVLKDGYPGAEVGVYLKHERLRHPDNLEWDNVHSWLWITDDSDPSILWIWDGRNLREVARHDSAEITGVESASDGSIYINLQHHRFAQDLTLRLRKK
jgi:sugar lactone lactonase YvrE